MRKDFEPRQGRPDQFRVDRGITRHEAAIVAGILASSPRHPYINPAKADKISVEPLPFTEGQWFFAEAIRANAVSNIDPGKTPPDQIASVVEKIKDDGQRLAVSERRAGLTVLPSDNSVAQMYAGQMKGDGRDPHDITALLTHDQITFQNGGPRRTVNVIVAVGIYRTSSELQHALARYREMGYGGIAKSGKSRIKGKGRF